MRCSSNLDLAIGDAEHPALRDVTAQLANFASGCEARLPRALTEARLASRRLTDYMADVTQLAPSSKKLIWELARHGSARKAIVARQFAQMRHRIPRRHHVAGAHPADWFEELSPGSRFRQRRARHLLARDAGGRPRLANHVTPCDRQGFSAKTCACAKHGRAVTTAGPKLYVSAGDTRRPRVRCLRMRIAACGWPAGSRCTASPGRRLRRRARAPTHARRARPRGWR